MSTLFCVLRVCLAGRARQAGLESKSVLPAIADLYVSERFAVSPRTASYGPEKCALWPMVFLELVGVGLRGVIFFIINITTGGLPPPSPTVSPTSEPNPNRHGSCACELHTRLSLHGKSRSRVTRRGTQAREHTNENHTQNTHAREIGYVCGLQAVHIFEVRRGGRCPRACPALPALRTARTSTG